MPRLQAVLLVVVVVQLLGVLVVVVELLLLFVVPVVMSEWQRLLLLVLLVVLVGRPGSPSVGVPRVPGVSRVPPTTHLVQVWPPVVGWRGVVVVAVLAAARVVDVRPIITTRCRRTTFGPVPRPGAISIAVGPPPLLLLILLLRRRLLPHPRRVAGGRSGLAVVRGGTAALHIVILRVLVLLLLLVRLRPLMPRRRIRVAKAGGWHRSQRWCWCGRDKLRSISDCSRQRCWQRRGRLALDQMPTSVAALELPVVGHVPLLGLLWLRQRLLLRW